MNFTIYCLVSTFYLVVASLSVLVNVQTFFLNALVYTQTVSELNAVEEGESTGGSPEVDHEDTKALSTEESPAVTVEGTV